MKTIFISFTISLCSCFSLFANPSIGDVTVRQRWPWSRLVDIDYVLTCDATNRVNVTLAANNGGRTIAIDSSALSGDRIGVASGLHRIVWDPAKSGCTNEILTQFTVNLTASAPIPSYMIVDLSTGAKTYRYDWSIWYDVTNGTTYKTDKLVFRHILPGTCIMGTPSNTVGRGKTTELLNHSVTLTNGYWLSVFEVTQQQYANVMTNLAQTGRWPSYFTNTTYRAMRPLEKLPVNTFRGTTPLRFNAVSGSFIALLHTLSGLSVDLPTEAEWVYACKAGVATTNWYVSDYTAIMRYTDNSGYDYKTTPDRNIDASKATAIVGSYLPNAWGLYDMLGNVYEHTWETYSSVQSTEAVIASYNPPDSFPYTHSICGGCYCLNQWLGRCDARSSAGWGDTGSTLGFRLYAAVENE